MVKVILQTTAIFALVATIGCNSKKTTSDDSVSAPVALPLNVHIGPISVPSNGIALAPALGSSGDHVKMVWLEQSSSNPKSYALMMSEYRHGVWGNTRSLYESPSIFANWADTPSVTANSQGDTLVHWAEKSGEGTYAYDVRIGLIRNQTFHDLGVVHQDNTKTEHGFVSIISEGEHFELFWLDGRNTTGSSDHHGGSNPNQSMTLRTATLKDRQISNRAELDSMVCDCCNTSAALSSNGILVAYRDRSQNEIRDISIARRAGAVWSKPTDVSTDGWKINGCPVNGPRIASAGSKVALAWYTKAEGKGRIAIQFSKDGGKSWADKHVVDANEPIGRLDLIALPNEHFVLSWMARHPKGASIMLQRISADGAMSPASTLHVTSATRRSGVPRLGRIEDDILVAWTEPTEMGTQLRAARITWQAIGTPLLAQLANESPTDKLKATPSLRMLELQDVNGQAIHPKTVDSKPLLVALWASWCRSCRDELKDLDALAAHHNLDIAVLTPSSNSPDDITKIIRENGYKGPIWFFKEPEFPSKFQIDELPTSWLFSGDNRLESVIIGRLGVDREELKRLHFTTP